MPPHLLVTQLRFARSELERCLAGVSEADGVRRLVPMNCISWTVGHLANQEQRLWLLLPGGQVLYPALNDLVGTGKPASTPPLAEMWAAWRAITQAVDVYLDTLTVEKMQTYLLRRDGTPVLPGENIGTLLMRNIDHYWFHIGESHAVRQMLGHPDLPQFVGQISKAPYFPES
jgi:hypothetical protein